MSINKETLKKILETSARSDSPLDDETIQEIATAAGQNPKAVLKDYHDRLGKDDAMPGIFNND